MNFAFVYSVLLPLFVFVEDRTGLFFTEGCLFAVTIYIYIYTFLCYFNALQLKANTKEMRVDIVFIPTFP